METIQIDYDPEKITYSQLLQVFFSSHNSTWPSPIRQYASAVMVHDKKQERLATEAMKDASERYGKKISTELLPYTGFTRAEDYHQKYYLRNTTALMDQYKGRFLSEDAFTDSTAIARLNGYVGGNGTTEQLEREESELGISTAAAEALREILKKAGKK